MEQQKDYQFVMIPQQLSSCLDANCHKMLSTLLGLHSLLANEDGWFYRSNKDLQLDVRLSENLIRATLDTLYKAGVINIDCIGKGRGHRTNRIHINFESFKKYQKYSFNDIRNNPELWIETVKYKDHFVPSYMKKSEEICERKCEGLCESKCESICEKVSTNTDTTDTSYITNTLNTIDKTYTKESINIDNEEYYLLGFLDNPVKDFRCLLDNIPYFINRNNSDLQTLQMNLKNKCNCEYTINEIVQSLQFLYKEKIGYKV